ncbi:DUF1353 domain-containing protein [Helicobacter sp. 11S02629-2]|uniref:DUF1353 domain-containing protein n=1 Tax=Helicobacter sp. 11S02629-2 TaxID=1476195 RepID=UPI000BD46C3F|nr:DUF1353 domain-containing protein [Helicobacter sp. 11S02629-2]PAF42764.1 hypothetical protein BKH40_07565 [Helicobacter sp. 11S02629-2]
MQDLNAKERLIVEVLDDGVNFKLINPLLIYVDSNPYIIPAGFITDFASIPKIFHSFLTPTGRYAKASVLHDYLIYKKQGTRLQIDKKFLQAMKDTGVSFLTRYVMYFAVRLYVGISGKR